MDRRPTAHHEAGHAVTALRLKCQVYEMYVVFPNGFTRHEKPRADYAFILYAGPWAQARAEWMYETIDDDTFDEDGHNFSHHVAIMFGRNLSDWHAYELERTGDASVVDAYELAQMNAYFEGATRYDVPAHITAPNGEWDRELVGAWVEIQALATEIIADRDALSLSDGAILNRVGELHWLSQDVPTDPGTTTGSPPEPSES